MKSVAQRHCPRVLSCPALSPLRDDANFKFLPHMTTSQILNCLGLSFDIIGVIMLFKYGLPADVSRDGGIPMLWQDHDEDEKTRWIKYNFRSRGVGIDNYWFWFSNSFNDLVRHFSC